MGSAPPSRPRRSPPKRRVTCSECHAGGTAAPFRARCLQARAARGRGRRAGRARLPCRDAHRWGQVAVLSAARARAGDGLVVVISPLIALMGDQLRRLHDAGVPATMLASGMAGGAQRRSAARHRRRADAGSCWRRPSGSPPAPFARRLVSAAGGAVRRRRGPLRGRVGPRLPARLPAPARRDLLARPSGRVMARHRDRHARAWPRRSPRGSDCASGCRPLRLRPAQPRLRRGERGGQGRGRAQVCRAAARLSTIASPRPAIVYCGTRKNTDDLAAMIAAAGIRPSPITPACARTRAGPARRRSWRIEPRWSSRPTRLGWVWTRRRCAQSPTGRCRRASRRTTRRPAAAGATVRPLERCCSQRGWTWVG